MAALLTSTVAEARLCAAVSSHAELMIHRTVHDHVEAMRVGSVALSVIELSEGTAATHVAAMRLLHSDFPSVPILAYCAASAGSSQLIFDVARAGATGLLLRDRDDTPHMIREAMRLVRRTAIREHLYLELAPCVAAPARPFLRYAIDHADARITVRHAAAELGVDPATIGDWLVRARAPSPHKFLTWIRLAAAASLLSDPGRSAQHVALELDFPSGTALRNILDRYVHLTTEEVKARGPNAVLDELKTVLSCNGR